MTTIARWESRSGKHHVTLYRTDAGYSYKATGGSGYLGRFDTDDMAVAAIAPRVNDFQPDANTTPMRRVM